MTTGEDKVRREEVRTTWLLSAPALAILTFAAAGPLLIVVVYSFLEPGRYGNVEWGFSTDAWVSIIFSRDIFDGTYSLADAHLTIFWRSVKLSFITTLHLHRGIPDGVVHGHPIAPGARGAVVPDHHSFLD